MLYYTSCIFLFYMCNKILDKKSDFIMSNMVMYKVILIAIQIKMAQFANIVPVLAMSFVYVNSYLLKNKIFV